MTVVIVQNSYVKNRIKIVMIPYQPQLKKRFNLEHINSSTIVTVSLDHIAMPWVHAT